MNIAFIFLKPFFNLINLGSLRRQKKKLKFTILTLLLNLTDANIVFNGVQHTYLC